MSATPERRALAERAAGLRSSGLLYREIAAELGVSYSYAQALIMDASGEKARERKRRYRGACIDCGAPTDGSNGPNNQPQQCAACAAKNPRHKKWTRETVIEVIQTFAAEQGRPPLSSEWLRRLYGYRFPPVSSVCGPSKPFATWADAIEAAGFPRPQKGRKVNRQGQGVSQMARIYHVLHRNGDGGLHEVTVDAYSPENAIEKVADSEGEYIAVLDNYWYAASTQSVSRFAVVK